MSSLGKSAECTRRGDQQASATTVTGIGTQRVNAVISVVVTYNPDEELLRAQTQQLRSQVAAIVWVDNGSDGSLVQLAQALGVHLLQLGSNHGVAHAQNVGVTFAWARGCDAVLLMDHDSVPAHNMVDRLMHTLNLHPKAAAAGACYSDPRDNGASSPFVWVEGLSLQRLVRQGEAESVQVDHLIASGCLIRQEAWCSVGPMSDALFVDFVDVEWCLRARREGWTVLGVWTAHMTHVIGQELLFRFGRNFRVHSPARMYFHVRNGLVLYRQPWIPVSWRMVSAYRLVLKMGFYTLCGRERLAYVRSMLKGLRDGSRMHLD